MSRSSSSLFRRMGACAIAALFIAGLVSCGGDTAGPATDGSTQASVTSHADAHLLAPQAAATTAFSAQVTVAPADKATISGAVRLEVKGGNLANVELLPAQGYAPKLAVFTISADKTTATATLDTTKLPEGIVVARISAFNAPAGSTTAKEIVAMPARTWTVKNQVTPGTFTAQVTEAPSNGATVTGPVRLVVTGSNLQNVELLPATGYSPKYATFSISADKKSAIAILDTRKLASGSLPVRISAFNAPAGSTTAKEIIAMPTRNWTIRNGTETNSWIFTDMGPAAAVVGINEVGEVAGTNSTGAFLYANGSQRQLASLGGRGNNAQGINNYGQVVGTSETLAGPFHAYLYKNGTITDLGVPPYLPTNTVYAINGLGINDSGVIVGWAGNGPPYRTFLYTNGSFTDLTGQLGNRDYFLPHNLNNAGQFLLTYNLESYAESYLYSNGATINLNLQDAFYNLASGLNNLGEVVGETQLRTGENGFAFLYRNGQRFYLGQFLGAQRTTPLAINDNGQIVGRVSTNNVRRAFLYRNGNVIDLNGLMEVRSAGWTLREATAINNSGQIAGIGTDSSGRLRGFVLTPVYAGGP